MKNRRVKKDITIRFIPNILEDKGRTLQSFLYNRTYTIRRYLKKSGINFEDMRIIVNGNEIKNLRQHLQSGDEIIVTPSIGEGTFWGAVAYWVYWIFVVASAIYSVVSAFTRPKKPSFDTIGYGTDEGSPSASWTGVKTVREPGGSVPVGYGRWLTGGTVINEYITTNGDKNFLNSLVAIGEGKFRSITLKRINRNPAENFADYTVETRLGTNDQSVIPNFEDLHNIHALNVPLTKDSPYVYTTEASDMEAFEVRLTLPGLFQQDSSGNILSWDVTYKVEYRVHPTPPDDPPYTDLGSTTISAKSRSEVRRTFRKVGLTAGQYDIRITRTSDDSSLEPMKEGDLCLTGVDEINTDDLEYPNTGLAGIQALATEQLSGDRPEYEFEVEREILVPKVMNGEEVVDWEDIYWDPNTEQYKLLVDDTVLTWDGETYVERFCANPIWCLYDLMTNTRYGIGNYITPDDNDLDYLLEMSRYCEEKVPDGEGGYEKRFRMDICIDSPQKALELIMQLSTIFRGLPFYSDNGKIRIAIDKPDTPVQLFGMGNIVEDSFSQTWSSKRDIPNIVYVQFDNKDNYYQQERICVVDEESLAAGKPINKKDVRYYGTKLSYAIRYGRNLIKTAKYIDQTISIKGGTGTLVRQCGEVVDIAHDVPQWGFSGSIKSGSTTTKIKLDREVVIEESKSYAVRVDFAELNEDGSPRYEERIITDLPGTYMEVNVSSAFSIAPAKDDIYSFGEVNKMVFPARIISLRRQRMGEVEMELQEYNEDIFDDSAVVIPVKKISALSMDIPNVENLKLTEGLVKSKDGTIQNVIDVWFTKPNLTSYAVRRLLKVKIYLSDNNGASWEYVGESYSDSFSIVKVLTDGVTYKVAVVSISNDNEEKPISSSPQTTIQLIGKSADPSDVEDFIVIQFRDKAFFGWTHIPDVDRAGYEIRSGEGWESGWVVASEDKKNNYEYPNLKIGANQKFFIKGKDTSGNYSKNATEAVVTIDNIPFQNIIESFSEQPDWTGDKDNLEVIDEVLKFVEGELIGKYTTPVRDMGYVATFKVMIEHIVTIGGDITWLDFGDTEKWKDLPPTLRWSGSEVAGAASFRIRTSEDNIEWSDWKTWYSGDYRCRYFQIEMTLVRSNVSQDMQCSTLNYYADLPDVDDKIEDEVTDADAGKDILFTKIFHKVYGVNITITSGDGMIGKIINLDTEGGNVKLYALDGSKKTGDFVLHGHGI